MKCMKQKAFGDQFLDTFINRHFDQPVMTCHTGFSRYKYDNTNTNTLKIQNEKADYTVTNEKGKTLNNNVNTIATMQFSLVNRGEGVILRKGPLILNVPLMTHTNPL